MLHLHNCLFYLQKLHHFNIRRKEKGIIFLPRVERQIIVGVVEINNISQSCRGPAHLKSKSEVQICIFLQNVAFRKIGNKPARVARNG